MGLSVLASSSASTTTSTIMLTASTTLRAASFVRTCARRNLSTSYMAAQTASDPIQQLFVDKVRDYANKKKSAGGKLVDATAETDAEMKREMEKIAKQYGGEAGTDMTKFPDMKFVDPAVEVPDLK